MGEKNYAFSWRGQPATPPTQAEMVASQTALAEESARLEAEARARIDALQPGDPKIPALWEEVDRRISDQAHFRRAANWHRAQVLEEQRKKLAREAREAEAEKRRAASLPVRDREFDEDVDAEYAAERESAWADIGGGMGSGR